MLYYLFAGVQKHTRNETLSVSKSDWSTIWMSSTTRTKLPFIVPFTKTLHSIAQCLCVITNHKRRNEQEKKEKQKHDKNREKTIEKNKWKRCTFETKTIQSFRNTMKNGKPFQRVVKRNAITEINKTINHAQNDVKN